MDILTSNNDALKPLILIVDDEPRLRDSLSQILCEDFQVITASEGMEGLLKLRSNKVSLVLLDLCMPQMNGVEMLKQLRTADNKVKVLIMTGKSSHKWAKECADLSVNGYIEKPFALGELLDKVKKLTGFFDCPLSRRIWEVKNYNNTGPVNPIVKDALIFIEDNFQKKIDRLDIASHLDVSPDYLTRLFSKECGIQPKKYIVLCRLQKSKEHLVKRPKMKIKDVAESVGIGNTDYFFRVFKMKTGFTPTEFREKSIGFD